MNTPSVLIVDDDLFVRESLRRLLAATGVRIPGTCASGEEALDHLAVEEHPDVVLMDIRMDGMNGLTAARTISARYPDIRVIILTSLDRLDAVGSAHRAGGSGFLVKDITPEGLLAAVSAVMAGLHVTSPGPHDPVRFTEELLTTASRLTSRERRILRALCAGATNPEIARALFISESTVKGDIQSLQNRLGAPTAYSWPSWLTTSALTGSDQGSKKPLLVGRPRNADCVSLFRTGALCRSGGPSYAAWPGTRRSTTATSPSSPVSDAASSGCWTPSRVRGSSTSVAAPATSPPR